MITTCNTAVTDAASEVLGEERCRKKPWVTKNVLDVCDERRDLIKKRYVAEGAKEYREAKKKEGSEESEGGLDRCSVRGDRNLPRQKNKSKRAYQGGEGPNRDRG